MMIEVEIYVGHQTKQVYPHYGEIYNFQMQKHFGKHKHACSS